MLYNVSSSGEYLEKLPNDWRKEKLEWLRSVLNSPELGLEEGINYKMLSYTIKGVAIFHLNAQKNYVSLYVGDCKKIDPTGELLMGIDVGKGCLRFKKSFSLEYSNVKAFISQAVLLFNQGKDIDC